MRNIIAVLFFILTPWAIGASAAEEHPSLRPIDLRCEYLADPAGIDVLQPGLSWRSEATDPAARGLVQSAYQIVVASTPGLLKEDHGDLWDSGKVPGAQSTEVIYAGKALTSFAFCFWKVRIWDGQDRPSAWSATAQWSMGPLGAEDWGAKWIGKDGGEIAGDQSEHRRLPARMLRRTFAVERPISRATAYVCGMGFFELYLNGQKISDHIMDPAISNYAKHVCYVTFDVTGQLKPGENAVGVILGNARFFAPRVKVPAPTHTFGYPKLLALIRVEHDDGSITSLVSDEKWKVTDDGPIRANSEYDGEEYDAGREMPGWSAGGFDDARWQTAQIVQPPPGELIAQRVEPMRVTQVIKPTAITNPKPGIYLVDFGQCLYGSVQLRVNGPRGTRVQIRTSYARRADGTLKTEDNRSALTTDIYTLRGGDEEEIWSPRFRGQGTRFAEITGFPGIPVAANFAFQVLHTDIEQVGEFGCSNELLNHIYANAGRSIRMQNRSVPMEPDRDERQPWLGHPAKSSESEGYVYGVDGFYNHFLSETRSNQRADGNISDGGWFWDFFSGDPVWPSVITVVPLWLHDFYGDQRAIEANYPAMKAWILFQKRSHLRADFTIDAGGYGDWVDGSSMDGKRPDNGSTSPQLIATAYFYHNCRLVAEGARLLGKSDDARELGEVADHVAEGFNRRFFDPVSGTYESRTQLSGALPLAFGLVPEAQRARVAQALVDDIVIKQHGHLSVGLIGMQWFMQALTQIGRPDLAYSIATQTTRPSWGYMISRGATSVWERWDMDTRDPAMNGESQMILAGDLVAWMYQTLGGIERDPSEPAFHRIILRPRIVGDLSSVHASFKSMYGPIVSDWRIEAGKFKWNLSIPPNTSATIYIPSKGQTDVRESGRPATQSEGVAFLRQGEEGVVYQVGSGRFQFESDSTLRYPIQNAKRP